MAKYWSQGWRVKLNHPNVWSEVTADKKGLGHFVRALRDVPAAFEIVVGERGAHFIAWCKSEPPVDGAFTTEDKARAEEVLLRLLKEIDDGDGVPHSAKAYSDEDRQCLIASATLNMHRV